MLETATEGSPRRSDSRRRIVLNGLGSSILLSLAAEARAAPAPFCGAVVELPSWAFTIPWQEELVSWAGYSTWTRVVGKKQGGGLFGFLEKDKVK